ncbi:MAG: helix-turn-helix domain-containing protein, partial [Bacteroidia bacterium]
MTALTVTDFYKALFGEKSQMAEQLQNFQNGKDIGHFNVFSIEDVYSSTAKSKSSMSYNRRTYYKISLISGHNIVEYADKEVEITRKGVLFASPKVPYRYIPQSKKQAGHFCVFTADFMHKSKTALNIDSLPIFNPKGDFIYEIDDVQYAEMERIFQKMAAEIKSDYEFKYDLLRTYVIELIHAGQKLKPITGTEQAHNASSRITTLFIELLERQFPAESQSLGLKMKTAGDFADSLGVHVNHLNKVLKESTGKTTTEIISARITQEAKILLKQTNLNVSEIALSLGFDEVAHFSNFFKKQTKLS